MQTGNETDVYAVRIKDKKILWQSSSGGAFTAIADYFLERGSAVACCYYNSEKSRTEYKLFLSKNDIGSARGSKYMYSFLGEIYNECIQWLIDNPDRQLLFVGTGCQTAGFCSLSETKRLRNRVFAVDLICHGLPSPIIWDSYVQFLEKKHKGSIASVSFRDKRNGWAAPTAYAIINGEEISLSGYTRMFYDTQAMRPACYKCPYATIDRYTDITIGDYWGIEKKIPEFYDSLGNSLLLVHTIAGKSLFSEIKDKLEYVESNSKDCWQYNLEFPTQQQAGRGQFWNDYYNRGGMYIVKKYAHPSIARKIYNKFVRMIQRI